jgi:hypothetical protein
VNDWVGGGGCSSTIDCSRKILQDEIREIRRINLKMGFLKNLFKLGMSASDSRIGVPQESLVELHNFLLQAIIEVHRLSSSNIDALQEANLKQYSDEKSLEFSSLLPRLKSLNKHIRGKLRQLQRDSSTLHRNKAPPSHQTPSSALDIEARESSCAKTGSPGAAIKIEGAIAKALPGHALRATCGAMILYLPVEHLARDTCSRCACQAVRVDGGAWVGGGVGGSMAVEGGTAWWPVHGPAEGWRFPAIFLGNLTAPPGIDLGRRWTSQVRRRQLGRFRSGSISALLDT